MIKLLKRMIKKLFLVVFFYHENTDYWWFLRQKSFSKNFVIAFIAKLFYRILINKYNSFLPLSIDFADKPVFPHGIRGVFISSGAKIGYNCVIFHQVTIGSNTLGDTQKRGAPTIGDSVYIGCGAKIIGNVKVGNNVRIGANCIVCEDIPDNSTVVLPKPRIIKKDKVMNNVFVCYYENNKI